MGCGLNKLEKRDDRRPGNIYSTLKRPQVETKIDVSYEYRFLEFTTLSAGEPGRSAFSLEEEGMATHSSILAWRIAWTEEPGRLQSMHGVTKSRT